MSDGSVIGRVVGWVCQRSGWAPVGRFFDGVRAEMGMARAEGTVENHSRGGGLEAGRMVEEVEG